MAKTLWRQQFESLTILKEAYTIQSAAKTVIQKAFEVYNRSVDFCGDYRVSMYMTFEEGDTVVLSDKHSKFDGEVGTVTQVVETMFGDANYTVSFEDGKETGVPKESLEEAKEDEEE